MRNLNSLKPYLFYALLAFGTTAHAGSRALLTVDSETDSPCFGAGKLNSFETAYRCVVGPTEMCVTIPQSSDPKQREFQISHRDTSPGGQIQTFHFPLRKSSDKLAGQYRSPTNWHQESGEWLAMDTQVASEKVMERVNVPLVTNAVGLVVASAYFPLAKLKLGASNLTKGLKQGSAPSLKFSFDPKARTLTVNNYYMTGTSEKGDCTNLKAPTPSAEEAAPEPNDSH